MPNQSKDVTAAVNEAKPGKVKTVTFDFDDESYEVSPDIVDDIEFLEAVEQNLYMQMAKVALGAQQWAKFKLTHKKADQAYDLLNAFSDAVGLGKSPS